MMINKENPEDPTKKLLELINLVKLQDMKPIRKNQFHFCTLAPNYLKKKENNLSYSNIKNNIILRNKLQGGEGSVS